MACKAPIHCLKYTTLTDCANWSLTTPSGSSFFNFGKVKRNLNTIKIYSDKQLTLFYEFALLKVGSQT